METFGGKGLFCHVVDYEKLRRRTTTMEGADKIGFVFVVEEGT
jgi:hypothetical protein